MTIFSGIALVSFLASQSATTIPSEALCEVAEIKNRRELHYALSRRAVDAINLAAASDPALAGLIAPTATFSLGSGDVGRPLGLGAIGAHLLTREMKADTFRFPGWDYMLLPIDNPCAVHKVDVEFLNTPKKNIFRVTFTFEAGRIVDASGWTRSYESGPVTPVLD
ncbi:hypothetical protein [Brevundimonas sp.]|uniref:hypothetical protein n=1 Tax=Brevundimonas sp. TaxID=1871086 RepID=UPI0025BFB3FB|nr:hypothetical protein [Brevundimonas sp.]